jgi:hypothetical protein
MSDIAAGRLRTDDNLQGGVETIYFFNYLDDAFTVTANVATAINASLTAVYNYDIQGDGNSLIESNVADKKTGTKVNTQTLVAQLKQVNSATNVELDVLLETRISAVYKDFNDQYRWIAIKGFNVTSTGELVTGGGRVDFNGYNVTLVAEQKGYSPSLDASTVTALLALVA